MSFDFFKAILDLQDCGEWIFNTKSQDHTEINQVIDSLLTATSPEISTQEGTGARPDLGTIYAGTRWMESPPGCGWNLVLAPCNETKDFEGWYDTEPKNYSVVEFLKLVIHTEESRLEWKSNRLPLLVPAMESAIQRIQKYRRDMPKHFLELDIFDRNLANIIIGYSLA